MRHTRRNVLGYSAAIAAASSTAFAQDAPLLLKTIPSSGETLPAIGVGTNRYGVGTAEEERAPLKATLRRFHELGGRVVDTAAVYGTSESVIGDLVTELEIRRGLFLATKTDLRGQLAGQPGLIERFQRLKTEVVDLMQVHNLVNLNEELAVMREWKQAGRIRYLGATISTANQFDQIERAMNDHADLDFVQFNYSLGDRRAAERLLPTAADRGLGVLINVPFGSGELFDRVENRELPDWAAEFDCQSWGQFFLKYVISHPTVTAAIPGTRRVRYANDNFAAARGNQPDAQLRRRQEMFFDSLA
jgi:aryl-alcohol dehydrogenase-like predicted oxidoreductase